MSALNTNTGFSANVNWPLVAGLGVAAAVLFYALYIVNNQLNTLDSAAQALADGVKNAASVVTSPLQAISTWLNPDGSGT
jgi:hypothetical protein